MKNILVVLLALGLCFQFHSTQGGALVKPEYGDACGVGEKVCGDSYCYNPKEKICRVRVPCAFTEEECHGKCYNPSLQKCVSQWTGPCQLNEEGCGLECYDPTQLACKRVPGNWERFPKLCKYSEEARGSKCYDPSLNSCAPPDYFSVCGLGQHACGFRCYDSSNKSVTCVERRLCLTRQLVCGGRCYWAREEICLQVPLSGETTLCTHSWLYCQLTRIGYFLGFLSFLFVGI